jgi:hypothetical protein
MKTTKRRWARYTLPAGFAKRGYPKASICHMTKRSMMVARANSMVVRLPASSTYTRGNKSNSHAKFAVTPYRRSTVLVKHPTQ